MQDVPSGPMKVKAASLAGSCRSFTLPKTKGPPPFFAWKRSFLLHCLSQPFACVLLCFVQRSSKFFLQNVLCHLVKMAVHGIDLASSAPLGDLLPGQFFVKFQIFVEIIRVDHGLIMFRQDRLVVGDGRLWGFR